MENTLKIENFQSLRDFEHFPESVRLKWLQAGLKKHLRSLQKGPKKLSKVKANKILKALDPKALECVRKRALE